MGVITGTIETEEDLPNGDRLVVSWIYCLEPEVLDIPSHHRAYGIKRNDQDYEALEDEKFTLDAAIPLCARNDDGCVIPVSDWHRQELERIFTEQPKRDLVYKAAKANYEREIKEWEERYVD